MDPENSRVDPETAIRELTKGRNLLTKLRSVLEGTVSCDERSELARDSCKGVLQAFEVGISLVKPIDVRVLLEESHDTMAIATDDADSPTSVLQSIESSHNGVKRSASLENPNPRDATRRRIPHSKTIVTPSPFSDGYQWRKYGEKKIRNLKHPRCYYKCTHEGCSAKLQVQQKFDSGNQQTAILYDCTYNDKHINHSINILPDIFQQKLPTPPRGSKIISFESDQPFPRVGKGIEQGHFLFSASNQRRNIGTELFSPWCTSDTASSSSNLSLLQLPVSARLQQAFFPTVPDMANTDCILSPPLSPAGQFYGPDALAYI